ncbi:hypothetical protein [Halanaerobium salsuginis]|jgi:hypothetical protein|nr:hypothetical protein [Halanaerobium salsuginis]
MDIKNTIQMWRETGKYFFTGLLIFLARITDVSLSTIRVLMIFKSRRI